MKLFLNIIEKIITMFRFILILFITFQCSIGSSGNRYYVNNAAEGNNSGTSWENAWTNFGYAQGLSEGDTVFISGGEKDKTYNETLKCEEGVVYKVGQDEGHMGTVIIDVNEKKPHCIVLDNNVMVSGQVGTDPQKRLICRNSNEHGIVKKGSSSKIRLFYIEVEKCGRIKDSHGIRIGNALGGCEIAYCDIHDSYFDGINCVGSRGEYGANKIHHCNVYNNSDDGIQLRGGFDIYNNRIYDNWQRPDVKGKPHPDGIQAQGKFLRIYNNELYNNSTFQIFVDQIRFEPPELAGHAVIYNNVCYLTDKSHIKNGFGIAYKAEKSVTSTVSDVFIFNNTIADMGYSGIQLFNVFGPVVNSFIKNNIIYNCRTSGTYGYVCGTSEDSGVEINYNLICSGDGGGDRMLWNSENFDYIDFVQRGFGEANGMNEPPVFVQYEKWRRYDLHLVSTDTVAIDKGASLDEYCQTDKDGVPRPKGIKWDIGAYEFNSGQ